MERLFWLHCERRMKKRQDGNKNMLFSCVKTGADVIDDRQKDR